MSAQAAMSDDSAEMRARFTRREIECLLWCSLGKTSSEIAMIVGLSEHTVNHYLISSAKKLECTNRVHAVANALRHGIIN
ncbi:response regulator transcription factor [Notoacmeibacter ruber]|uniref:LuxR family transcriptional regulator n=1 Tax=Notoacmeibacter ruber TaxID=2670375 RepID=A0A3L7JEQ7_9HYPH|nr:helix-turn-helix transcriptional regulator [Notoacmeibacter ruber]RLQ88799.1 LuxR family transcriptional regulator [Notoacmeibacter ruber]